MWRDTDYLTSFLAKDIIDLNYKKKKKKKGMGYFCLRIKSFLMIIQKRYS